MTSIMHSIRVQPHRQPQAIRLHSEDLTGRTASRCDNVLLLSLCAASWMWVRHHSDLIVPPEGGLEFSAGLTKKIVFYLCHG